MIEKQKDNSAPTCILKLNIFSMYSLTYYIHSGVTEQFRTKPPKVDRICFGAIYGLNSSLLWNYVAHITFPEYWHLIILDLNTANY